MTDGQLDLQGLMQHVEKREKAARQRTLLLSLIPAALGLLLIIFAWGQIGAAQAKVTVLEAQVRSLQDQVRTIQAQRDALNQELQQSSTFAQYKCPYNLQAESKAFLGSVGPGQAGVWDDVLRFMDNQPHWLLGGVSPDTGFNGPGFAAYILTKNKIVPGTAAEVSGRLSELLAPERQPRPGDVVFYDQGYTMFYFLPRGSNQPCVVGMTPVGVLALNFNWRPPLRFGAVPYR